MKTYYDSKYSIPKIGDQTFIKISNSPERGNHLKNVDKPSPINHGALILFVCSLRIETF
jgi:hypothetical protein